MSQIFVPITSSMPSIPTSFVTDNGTAVPIGNVLNIIGDPLGVATTSGSTNNVKIFVPGGGTNWITTGAFSFTMAVNTGYFLIGGSPTVTVSLPLGAKSGNICELFTFGLSNNFKIIQRVTEQILFLNTPTSIGTLGSLTSVDEFCYIKLIFIAPNFWGVIGSIGSFTTA